MDSTGLQATGKTMVLTPARDTESDTESLVLGGKSCKLWKLQPTERL